MTETFEQMALRVWEAEQKLPEEIEKEGGKYVINRPMEISMGSGDKATAGNLRLEYAGIKNEQILRGNKLADEIRKLVPTPEDRSAMFWYKAAEGNPGFLQQILTEAPKAGQAEIGEYRAMILRAYQYAAHGLPANLQQAMRMVDQYYKESGLVASDVGTIKAIRDNYMNRIYAPDRPQDFVKTELKGGLKQSTRHGLQRVYDTEFDAIKGGKKFATTDVADALAIHNEEMAYVNSSRKLADVMVSGGIAEWNRPGNQHVGWEQVGRLEKRVPIKDPNGQPVLDDKGNQFSSHTVLYAPPGIAKGLRAITDPNYTKQIDWFRGLQKYQGLVKTIDLGFSLFHHFTFAMQAIYQNNLKGLLDLPTINRHLDTPEFKDLELDFARNGGMTTGIEENADILRNLAGKNPDTFQAVRELPVAKQVLGILDKSSNLLFNGIQRMLKVTDYGVKTMNWIADHQNASDAEIKAAKQGFAKEINAVYGGLNWEAMGVSKWALSLMRLGLLAPDWTTSNMALLKYAVGDWSGTSGAAARGHILRALLVGFALTEGLNYMLQGHFTDQNPRGHALEVMIAPDVYVSFYRGGIGDILKLGSNIREFGVIAGSSRFLQGKMAPVARTFTGIMSGVQYTGRPIAKRGLGPIGTEVEYLKYLLSNMGPMPFGLSSLLQLISKGKPGNMMQGIEDEFTRPEVEGVLPKAMVLAGLARYSKPMSAHTAGIVKQMRGPF